MGEVSIGGNSYVFPIYGMDTSWYHRNLLILVSVKIVSRYVAFG